MKILGRLVFYTLLLLVLVFWTLFTIYNPEYMELRFINWSSIALPISVWLLVAFLFGAICGLLLCASGYFKGKAAQKNLRVELERRDAEEQPAQSHVSKVESQEHRPMRAPNVDCEGSSTN